MRNKLLFIAVLLVSVNMFSWSSFRKNVPQRLVQPSGETIHVLPPVMSSITGSTTRKDKRLYKTRKADIMCMLN